MINRILSDEQCASIAEAMLRQSDALPWEPTEFYKDSKGVFNLPEAVACVPQTIWRFENCYTRIYRKGSCLRPHTDRPGLDLTLSVCVHADVAWPLCVSNVASDIEWDAQQHPGEFLSDFTEHYTDVGYGLFVEGRKYPHWRRELRCKENEMVIQTFFHWSYK